MKKKLAKTVMGIAALAMASIMTVSVGAAVNVTDGTYAYDATATYTLDTIQIPKGVQVFNTSGHQIYSPNITFSYSVEPVTINSANDVTVKDTNGNTAVVRSGVESVVNVKTYPTFTPGTTLVDATEDSKVTAETTINEIKKVTANLELKVNLKDASGNALISVPGIYRYVITDTTPQETLTNAGITRNGSYDTKRYLDVYVVNGGTDGSVKLGGYVLFTAADGTTATITDTTGVAGGGEKVPGYEVTSETTVEDQKYLESKNTSDEYHTYNVLVEKEVTGNFGDRSHKFPFSVTTSSPSGAKYVWDALVEAGDTATVQTNVGNAANATTVNTRLKNGESCALYGLPNNTAYSVTEKNDTADTYEVTVTDISTTVPESLTNGVLVTETSVKANETKVLSDQSTANETDDEDISVRFTNNLDSVTPTGIFLRYAPYILMAAAALILVLFLRRKKTED